MITSNRFFCFGVPSTQVAKRELLDFLPACCSVAWGETASVGAGSENVIATFGIAYAR
jgi:hypothetical protein